MIDEKKDDNKPSVTVDLIRPQEMTQEEIDEWVAGFVKRAKDIVEEMDKNGIQGYTIKDE